MRTPDEICHLFHERRLRGGVERERMREMCALYQGDIAIPLPEMGGYDRPAVINFARMGINQMGMRVASTMPIVEHIPIDYGVRDRAERRAKERRQVNHGWWGKNRMPLQLRQRGRWYFAYAQSPVVVRPCFDKRLPTYGMPMWQLRSPLDCYAATTAGVTDLRPCDAMFAQTRTVGWVRYTYPDQAGLFRQANPNDLVDVIEYLDIDEAHIVASLTARRFGDYEHLGGAWTEQQPTRGVTLERVENRTDMPWTTVAGNISLERRVSNYEGMLGMYQAQAKLQALGLIAKQRSVFQTEWLIGSTQNVEPVITVQANPEKGIIGKIRDGKIDRYAPDPQYANDSSIDRLERSQRVEAGVPASFGGEAASNVRTGKTLSGLVDDSVQPLLAEAHEVFAASLHEENRTAIAIDKAYFGPKTFFVSFNGDKARVTYEPETLWETDEHIVRYPYPGADVAEINIATGQAMGAGLMSKRTAARLNPLVENAEVEHDELIYEQLESALLQQILAMASTPGAGLELIDMAEMVKRVRADDVELVDAIIEQQKRAQERQATPAEDPAEAMPGMSPPGQGVEQPAQFATTPGQDQLSQLLFSLRAPQMQSRVERGVPA